VTDLPIKKGLYVEAKTKDEKPYLLGSRCRVCRYTCFPRKEVCVVCRKENTMEEVRLGESGTLESFAVMQVGPPGFQIPYIIGYIRTREGALVFAPITGCEAKDDALKIGEEMELVIEKVKEDGKGNNLIGWKYRPIGKRGR
jgi:uncharacterized OB-fold protein